MAGLAPAIHVFEAMSFLKTWMPGIKPGIADQIEYIMLLDLMRVDRH
jgi:hypothetical protein